MQSSGPLMAHRAGIAAQEPSCVDGKGSVSHLVQGQLSRGTYEEHGLPPLAWLLYASLLEHRLVKHKYHLQYETLDESLR